MSERVTIREYESLYHSGNAEKGRLINKTDWQQIHDYVRANPNPNGSHIMEISDNRLKAVNYVGMIQTKSGTTVEILPKVQLSDTSDDPQERHIFLCMLRRYRRGPSHELSDADIRAIKNFPLLEAFITVFLNDILALAHRGLAHAYREVEGNQPFLKGKLLMAPHLRHNLIHKERFYVRYQEFSPNRPINRLLKSTLLLLQRISRSHANLSRITQAQIHFEDIPPSANIDADLAKARIDRTMPLYRRLFPLAQLFLKNLAPTTWRGDKSVISLLFPMEKIFEDYITHRLSRIASDWKITSQDQKHYLMDGSPLNKEVFRLKPDIVARKDDSVRILDAKWKNLSGENPGKAVNQADLYQMYSYAKKYQQKESPNVDLRLLYPQTEDFQSEQEFTYEHHPDNPAKNLKLTIHPINLAEETRLEKQGKTTLANLLSPTTTH